MIFLIAILKILKSNKNITLNGNMNGFYINLSFLPCETDNLVIFSRNIHEQVFVVFVFLY